MRHCDNCGIIEAFTELKYIPPVYIKPFRGMTHDSEREPIGSHIMCIDEYACMRRFGMRMKPRPYYARDCSHALIECCGELYNYGKYDPKMRHACTGLEEEWKFLDDDPFPEHRYVCSSCRKPWYTTRWKELSPRQPQPCHLRLPHQHSHPPLGMEGASEPSH